MSYFYIGAAIVAGVSAISAGDANRKALHTQADIAQQKSTIAVQQSTVNEDAQRRRGALARGRMTASAAEGSGLDGTNLDVIQQSATDTEVDALNIRYAGKLGQMSDNEQASLDNMGAESANDAGYLNAGAAALSSYGGYVGAGRRINKAGGLD